MNDTENLLNEVYDELARARSKFPAFNSAHEGYAVILEELDELWMECKSNPPDVAQMREEAVQVAAMAVRFMIDVCGTGVPSAGVEHPCPSRYDSLSDGTKACILPKGHEGRHQDGPDGTFPWCWEDSGGRVWLNENPVSDDVGEEPWACVCGHRKADHIYEEGACRPGYRCPSRCAKFEPHRESAPGTCASYMFSDRMLPPIFAECEYDAGHEGDHGWGRLRWEEMVSVQRSGTSAGAELTEADLEAIRDLLRYLSSAPDFMPKGADPDPIGYSVYKSVWEKGRYTLTKLERLVAGADRG